MWSNIGMVTIIDDSQIHFVEKMLTTHLVLTGLHKITDKFDQRKVCQATIDLSDQKIGQYPAFYMQVDPTCQWICYEKQLM